MSIDPSVAGPQAAPAVVSEPTPAAAPPVLSEKQRDVLRAVCNRIVPANGSLAGAGDLGVGRTIERTLSESARLRRLFLDGLATIAITAQRTHIVEFATLDEPSQIAVLENVERTSPAFFTALVEHTYRGYYTLPALRMRPPQPIGYTLPPFDPTMLDNQRQRAPFWRRTE